MDFSCSSKFETFLKHHGIKHVRASPYHPQVNGIVERMHGTLNTIIAKTVEKKGSWPEIVPMALYFIRSTPCTSLGFAPFQLKHGWEPATPLRLLYKGWVQDALGEVDLEEWVLENSERVQDLKEKAVLKLKECERQSGMQKQERQRYK